MIINILKDGSVVKDLTGFKVKFNEENKKIYDAIYEGVKKW